MNIEPTCLKELVNTDYTSLMEKRIHKILFICSNYDTFMMREDGQIEDKIQEEYDDLNLTLPPIFRWVNSSETAVDVLKEETYDLVIAILNLKDPNFFNSLELIKNKIGIPIVLLINYSKKVSRTLKEKNLNFIDYIFSWNGNANLILAIVKLIEDRMNAENDILIGKVRAILLVEDSIKYYSTYLPAIYKLVLKQCSEFIDEAMNETELKMRKRARPKIFLAKNLDEALEYFNKYNKYLIGVISDIAFVVHKNDSPEKEKQDAGIELAKIIKAEIPEMPIILQSSQKSMEAVAKQMGLGFIEKYSKTLLLQLSQYMSESFSFGDFIIRDKENGEITAIARNLMELQKLISNISDKDLHQIIIKRKLSKWMYSRGLFELASIIRSIRKNEENQISESRKFILDNIADYRMLSGQGVIANFDKNHYSRYIWFSKLGDGSLGGKARGLAFINKILAKYNLTKKYPGITLSIPRTITIASDYFDSFIIENGLQYVIDAEITDDEILAEFINSRLPESLIEKIKAYIDTISYPLAIRSSSILEDSHYQPFAGIYSTYMVPYTKNKDQMVRLISKAIKSVYASVYYSSSRAYIQSTSNMLSEEKMAIVIQGVCGSEDSGYYFPTISGVARSVNYYPLGNEKTEDGVVNLAFGLGKLIVEGEKSIRFSPKHPHKTLQLSTPRITLNETQNAMYALDLQPDKFKTSVDDGINIHKFTIPETENFRNLAHVASTWDMNDSKFIPNILTKGNRVITFSRILQYNTLPIPKIIADLLEICRHELGAEIEIEFAVNMDVPKNKDIIFNILQVRPISEYSENIDFDITQEKIDSSLVYSEKALGFGFIEDVTDIIYIKEDTFDKSKTQEMAEEIGRLNKEMAEKGRNYILIGPGRWGSSDPWLGIPINWSQISEAKVIIESGIPQFNIDPSQGTHFFQNITSLGVGYITINPFKEDGIFNKELLKDFPSDHESHFIKRYQFRNPPSIFIDGKHSKGIIIP